MKLNIKIVNVLNPGQTQVDMSDCPVYALTKEVQFRFPDQFADYVAMFGGLHIEQCLLVIHGQLIHGSGLPEVLSQCSLATIGVSVVVDVNQIKRARYCIQVNLCALYQKLCVAVKKDESPLHPLQWLGEKSKTSGMCYFWRMVTNLQIEILIFVRSLREGNFPVYVQTMRNLLKWFFALDHYNYAWWLTVHVFDLLSLSITHPDVYQNMLKGCFSFAKSHHQFSRIA